jgi:hypothetical protein
MLTGRMQERSRNSETEVVESVGGLGPAAKGRAEVFWAVAPGTTAQNARRRVVSLSRRAISEGVYMAILVGVFHPLSRVAKRIVKTEGVGQIRTYRSSDHLPVVAEFGCSFL